MKAERGTLRYWLNLAVFTVFALVLGYFAYAYLGVSYFMARGFTHPNSPPVCCITPEDYGYDYEEIELETADGLKLGGWHIPSENRAAVVILHAIGGNRLGVMDHAALLAENGYGVVMLDIRAHGESEGEVLSFGGDEYLDVVAAVDFMLARPEVDPGRIGILGNSLGAQVGLLAAAQDERIAALAADAPGATVFADWPKPESFSDALYVPFDLMFFFYLHRFDGVKAPVSLLDAASMVSPRPLLLIGGESDARAVNQFYAAAGEPKEIWIVEGGGHIEGLGIQPEAYRERVVGFFDRYLLED